MHFVANMLIHFSNSETQPSYLYIAILPTKRKERLFVSEIYIYNNHIKSKILHKIGDIDESHQQQIKNSNHKTTAKCFVNLRRNQLVLQGDRVRIW